MVNIWQPQDLLLEFYIFEKAYPQARPRINKHTRSIFSPLENQKAVRRALSQYDRNPIKEEFCLLVHFFLKDYKDYRSTDSDNLLKAMADSLQATGVVSNDNLMVMCTATKNLSEEDWIWMEIRKAIKLNIPLEDISKMQFRAS